MNSSFFLSFFFLFALKAFSQEPSYTLSDDSLVNFHTSRKKVYHATRTEIKPKIDGRLDDECWQHVGTWESDFIQQQPNQAGMPSQKTEIKILYDDAYLYIAFICHDNEPEKIRAVLGRRDEIMGDRAGVALDSYFDKLTAFEFNVTAAGQKIDLMHLGEYGWDYNWDAVWDGKASVGDSAWFAEIRVPFSQLRFANKKEHVWGVHFWRWIDRLKEENHWKLIPVDAPAMVYIFGELHGLEDIPYRRNFEVMPYFKTRYISDTDNKIKPGFGVDGKIGVTSNFTLDYTVNPDFGQIEADPSVLNLTSYEVFYNEKRPFFLEGNSILEYGAGSSDLLFYSRRIGAAPDYIPYTGSNETTAMPEQSSILNAVKLSGKNHSGLSLGVINSMTTKEHAVISSANSERQEIVEPFTNYFIGRIKQDFNNGNTVIGGIITSTIRNIKDEHLKYLPDNALVGGFDFHHNWLNRKYFTTFKGFMSRISGSQDAITSLQLNPRHYYQRPDATHLNFDENLTVMQGTGGEIRGGKRSGKFRIIGSLDWRSPGLELNDLGYLWQADYINQGLSLLYWINKPKGILNSWFIDVEQKHYRSYGGEQLGDELSARARLQFKNLWKLDLVGGRVFYNIDTRQLRGGPSLRIDGNTSARLFLQTNSSKNLFLGGGPQFIWSDDNISFLERYNIYIQWLIKNRISFTSSTVYSVQTENNQYVMNTIINDENEYILGKIDRKTLTTTLRAEIFLTPELSFQYYGSPYASVGKYDQFKKVADSKSPEIKNRYTDLDVQIIEGNITLLDENQAVIRDLTQRNPDFNFQEFRSNFVARWEYKTGSTIYLVWTNNRSRYNSFYEPSILKSMKGINSVAAENVFMVKISLWFSI